MWGSGGGGGGGGTTPSPPAPPPDTSQPSQADIDAQRRKEEAEAKAQAQYEREVQANIIRERKAGRTDVLGLTQPERDILKSQEFYGGGTGERIVFKKGKAVAVESSYFQQSMTPQAYTAETARIASVYPVEKYLDVRTGEMYDEKQVLFKNPEFELTTTPIKTYATPEGKQIYDLQTYMKEKNIPFGTQPTLTAQQFKESLKEPPTYDIKSLYSSGTALVPKWQRESLKGVEPITTSDVLILTGAGVGLAKGGIATGAKILFSEQIVSATSGTITKIQPPDVSLKAQVIRGGLVGATFPITATSYLTSFGVGLATEPKGTLTEFGKYVKTYPIEFGTSLAVGNLSERAMETSLFGKKPYQLSPSENLAKAVEPTTRQRVTLLLKEPKGQKYILGRTKSGEIISIGGGIEKGESLTKALAKEVRQEVNIPLSSISGLKKIGKIVFPEETHYVFTGTLKEGVKLRAGSDISKIVYVNPKKFKGVTGQTPFQPVSRISLKPLGRIRAYEAGLINYAETGTKPTWLALKTEYGTYLLGTQSRYNVAYGKQLPKADEFLYAHGTPKTPLSRKFNLKEKQFRVEAEKTFRGEQGLYLQPPSAEIPRQVIKLEEYTGKGRELSTKEINKLTFGVPKEQYGYIGLSYLQLGKTFPPLDIRKIKVGKASRGVILLKERKGLPIISTEKALRGGESERLVLPKTTIETTGFAGTASISLKRISVQPARILRGGTKGKRTPSLPEVYGESYYITSSNLSSLFKRTGKTTSSKAVSKPISVSGFPSSSLKLPKSLLRGAYSYKQPSSLRNLYSPLKKGRTTRIYEPYSTTRYKEISLLKPPKYPPYIPPPEEISPRITTPILKGSDFYKRQQGKIKRKGREDIAVLSGFTSSILKIGKIYTPKEIKIKGLKLETGLGLRPIPIIK